MVMYLRPESWAAATASGKRAFVSHLGELDQHRKIDPGEHLYLGTAHHRDRKIRRRASEHIGENGYSIAAVDALDGFDDVVASLLNVIVGPDHDCLDLLLRTDHVLERRAELDGEAPVRDENETDH